MRRKSPNARVAFLPNEEEKNRSFKGVGGWCTFSQFEARKKIHKFLMFRNGERTVKLWKVWSARNSGPGLRGVRSWLNAVFSFWRVENTFFIVSYSNTLQKLVFMTSQASRPNALSPLSLMDRSTLLIDTTVVCRAMSSFLDWISFFFALSGVFNCYRLSVQFVQWVTH